MNTYPYTVEIRVDIDATNDNYGWGWKVPEAPECPSFAFREQAATYTKWRNQGYSHEVAWKMAQPYPPPDIK